MCIRDRNTLAVEIYPNPFSDNLIFTVSLPSTAPITLRVMNLTGQVVLQQVDIWLSPNQSYPINMTTFPKGAYWIRIESKEGVAIKKVVKL